MKRLAGVFILALLVGCGSQRKTSKNHTKRSVSRAPSAVEPMHEIPFTQFEARYASIPFPLCIDAARVLHSADQQFVVSFRVVLDLDQIRDFYVRQMELLGWECVEQFYAGQLLLRFERPDARLTLVVWQKKTARGVHVPSNSVTMFVAFD